MSNNTFLRQMQQQEFDALVAEYAAAHELDAAFLIRRPAYGIPKEALDEMSRKSGHHYGPTSSRAGGAS